MTREQPAAKIVEKIVPEASTVSVEGTDKSVTREQENSASKPPVERNALSQLKDVVAKPQPRKVEYKPVSSLQN